MRRLYLQVYLTIVASLVLVVLAAGVLWRFMASAPTLDQTFGAVGEVLAQLVPPADAPRAVQQQAVARLAARFGTDLGLFAPSGQELASAGTPVPEPRGAAHAGGLIYGRGGAAYAVRLPDGRSLVARIPVRRRRPATSDHRTDRAIRSPPSSSRPM